MNSIHTSEAGAELLSRLYREQLSSWPVPSDHRYVPTSHGETFVLSCGPADAPPVLLLHGAATNALNWFTDAPAWAREFRLHAVDLIGEPGLSAPSRPPLTTDAHARWLDEVLGALGLETVAVVGESLGGWVAVDYASRRPGRVSRLALLCPGGLGRQRREKVLLAALLMVLGRRRAAMSWLCGTSDIPEYARIVSAHFRPRMEKLPLFTDAALRRLAMPVLVIAGDRDRMFDSAGTRRRLARAVPHAVVRRLADDGHFLPRQTGPIAEFLRSRGGTHS
ncbi:alpha/beta hydrolase [Saccharopolyspora sp. NFXS83]|uniref:alpha/beta fold hydrolase n=1 Tax=Saccharopolyspora sp. NFXS83 TaxID=2993560 RepID=UPI00224B8850|nr:alpha/beta hydrolase [Saccharopolyspora sp. NFXS83]MCX2729975.1 alpha/beta hydrolase [Saccharopolyspora sp. NFXS83]